MVIAFLIFMVVFIAGFIMLIHGRKAGLEDETASDNPDGSIEPDEPTAAPEI